MRFPDRRYYCRIASSSAFRPEPLERVFRLAMLLQTIGEELGSEVSLRGGTALNLLHLGFPRLSVDIDFDFVGTADADEAKDRRPALLERIEELARGSGYEVISERASYAMAHLRMNYDGIEGHRSFIKIDVNFLDRVPVMLPERRLINHPFQDDLPAYEIQTLALPELAAAKLIALCRRALARDLFDASALSELAGLQIHEVRTVLVARGAAYSPPSPEAYEPAVVDRVKKVSWNSEVVALARRPTPFTLAQAKNNAGELLAEVLKLGEGHRQFLDLLNAGELRPEVLPLAELHPRIAAKSRAPVAATSRSGSARRALKPRSVSKSWRFASLPRANRAGSNSDSLGARMSCPATGVHNVLKPETAGGTPTRSS
jgi:predicted nucleotidyltransferase component of viral defense system